jgi:hypothetical protein
LLLECLTVVLSSRDNEDALTILDSFDSLFVGQQQSYTGLKKTMLIITYCVIMLSLGWLRIAYVRTRRCNLIDPKGRASKSR